MQISVTVTGLDKIDERLTALGKDLYDFTATFTTLGAALILFYSDTVFNSHGQALGKTWQPLSPSYDAWKSRHYPGRGILERTGTMRKSFYAKSTPTSLFIGNSAMTKDGESLFNIHQLGTGSQGASASQIAFGRSMLRIGGGTRVGRGNNLPARPMIGVNNRVETLIQRAIQVGVKAKIESTMA